MSEKLEKNVKSNAKKRTLVFAAAGALALAALGYVAINRPASENDGSAQATRKAPTSDFERTLAKLEELRPLSVQLIQLIIPKASQEMMALEIAIKYFGARENIDYFAANVKSIKVVPFKNLKDENVSVKYFVRVVFSNGDVRYYDEEKVGGYERAELSTFAVVGELSEDEIPEIATMDRLEVYKQFDVVY
ncbi:MAG: hypothetical protein J6K20_07045 [Thermoguttaceae bacterium]|nr:hypothetical protein [Thermoguttaceae bacterium]